MNSLQLSGIFKLNGHPNNSCKYFCDALNVYYIYSLFSFTLFHSKLKKRVSNLKSLD